MVVLIVFFLKLFLVSGKKCLHDNWSVCPKGFYGEDCLLKCQCPKNVCHADGTCHDSMCMLGSFGLLCEREDMSWLAADVSPCELFDGEDNTCVNTLNQNIELRFTQDVLVKSFTLDFNEIETDKADSFLVSVWADPDSGSKTAQALAVKKANSQSVVVDFITPVKSRNFTVVFKTALLLCSLHIDGGCRLKQHASIYMGDKIEYGVISKLRDGNSYSSCVDISSVNKLSVLTFTWKYIFKVEIYLKEYKNEEIVLQVSGNDVENKTFEFTVESRGNNPVLLFVNREVRQTDIHWNYKKFHVCEVEIFGETSFENLAFSAQENDIYSSTLQTRSSVFYGIVIAVCVAMVLYQISQRCEKKAERKAHMTV